MIFKHLIRGLHTSGWQYAVEKSGLAVLRKKTGYTFANCKKALELHNNDLAKAEKWLNEQAQSLGWSKATKLEGRSTKQGLIGVLVEKNIGAMVEINCETDFVAKNSTFQQFVNSVTETCCSHVQGMTTNNGGVSKIDFDSEALKQMKFSDGKNLSDHLALIIGKVGENASLRRATCFKVNSPIQLAAFAHPPSVGNSSTGNSVQVGRFGSIVALKQIPSNEEAVEINEELKRNICQHVIGMNPQKIGTNGVDEPAEQKDDEQCLIYQEYLLDPSTTVNEVLKENCLDVVEFYRYECGETLISDDKIAEQKKTAVVN